MQLIDGRPVFAATDLVGFLACEHLTALERAAAWGKVRRPERVDPELDVIRKRGEQHERQFLEQLRAEGREVAEIQHDGSVEDHGDRLRLAAAETERALSSGVDAIYQATFFDGRWRGHADFLLRVGPGAESPWGGELERAGNLRSRFGDWHYEVVDTKLARHAKASALLQICSYLDQLTPIQGVEPEWMHVALGGSAHETVHFRVADFMAYYRAAKRRLEEAVLGSDAAPAADPAYPPTATYPDPVEHCEVCRWAIECQTRRRADDHLSLVAGISTHQRKAFAARGVTTVEALAAQPIPIDPPLDGTSAQAVERVQEQARIQIEGRRARRTLYELLLPPAGQPIDPERGLATLPPPSQGDLFFDIEADPYALDDGIAYLFGVLESDGTFHPFWATEPDGSVSVAAEKRAFEACMDFIADRLTADPTLHIYHFAPYEATALKRLMGRHATREGEVDRLLRGGVLVDLHRAVRQGLRASVESYSIKKLETLYGFRREVDLRDAGSSIVAFEQWLELGETDRPTADHLTRIEGYNRDDVMSNKQLRDWLEERRVELAKQTGYPAPRPEPRDGEPQKSQADVERRVADLAERLTRDVPVEPTQRTPEQQGGWLLAQLLSWHRREDKSAWWEFFRLTGLGPLELIDEDEAIGGLEPVALVLERSRGAHPKVIWRYRYPDQDHSIAVGVEVYDPELAAASPTAAPSAWRAGTVVALDLAERTVDIRRDADAPAHPQAIVALTIFRTPEQREALYRIGQWVADTGLDAPGPYRAARDLILRRPPRTAGPPTSGPLRREGENDLDAARRLVLELDKSTLAIQGPPGSGKTYTGARMIAALLREGRRVGITATSHKVIGNLLIEAIRACEQEGVDVRPMQRANEKENFCGHERVAHATSNERVLVALSTDESNLVGGTAWLWSDADLTGTVDALFVEEAGQISLANVVAVSPAASSIVLLGDPQQLDQPLRGAHPPGADRSALAHLLGAAATMPRDRGLFLETTWRLHPDVCRFTSETFYDGRLKPQPHLARQSLEAANALGGTGLRVVWVPHSGNDNESTEEVEQVARLAQLLVGGGAAWIDGKGHRAPVGWEEVLIVAPYNAQVGAIGRRLPDARVGTVDKFQGQEAPVSIYSMTTSSPEEAPRGMDFLYSRNRLNVATSRALCVAVVVCSPELVRVRAHTPEQMRLANALCRFVEQAEPHATG